MLRRSTTLLSLSLLAACGTQPVSAVDGAAPRGVILICIDTLRADRLGCYGYDARETSPRIDELARRSTVFADVTAPAGWTKPSVPSFLTGLYPLQHGVYEGSARGLAGTSSDALPDDATTLAERFRDAGWRTAAFVRNAQLRPGLGFEQGFELYRDEAGDARSIRWRALDWLDGLGPDEPFFLYLHLLDVHMPYPIPDECVERFLPLDRAAPFREEGWRDLRDAVNDGERELTAGERGDLDALYDASIRYVDDELGRLLDGLALRGLDGDAIVAIVSDHGEELGERGRIGHGHGLSEVLLSVPWILHVPGEPGQRVESPVNLVDLYPTLLASAGLALDGAVAGIDRRTRPTAARPLFAEHKAPDRYLQSLRAGSSKLVRAFEGDGSRESALPIGRGERWEAEFELGGDGALRATQLKPRDEDPDDPTELKGVLLGGPRAWTIAGIPVELPDALELQWADGAEGAELGAGAPLKLRGTFEGGRFRAVRAKLYPTGGEVDHEVRGRVDAVRAPDESGPGEIVLGGFTLPFDGDTKVRAEERERMSRGEARAAAALGEAAVEHGFTLERWSYDLATDPLELAPANADPRGLGEGLDRTGAELLESLLAEGERVELDAAALKALEDIGY